MALRIGHSSSSSSSSSSSATDNRNPLKKEVLDLESKLSQIREVLRRAGLNGWIQREDDEVWSWLEKVGLLEEEILVELKKRQLEIAEAVRDPVPAVKVLYSIPCVRYFVKRVEVQGSLLWRIKSLRGKIESGFKDDDVIKFNNLHPDSESVDRNKRPLTTCELRVNPVRQQRRDCMTLIDFIFLNSNAKKNQLISINGVEGSGKTTLAQLVYNDSRVQECFQVKWVCVANYFDKSIDSVRKELLEDEDVRMKELLEDEEDVKSDDARMSKKRLLLVLDDVHGWGSHSIGLSFCKSLLKKYAPGSVILVTTSPINMRLSADHQHNVATLSTKDCWSILRRVALSGNPQSKEWNIIGKKFAEKCEGLPLAAKIVGDYLKSKATVQDWEDALGDDQLYIWQIKGLFRKRYPTFFSAYEKFSSELKQFFPYFAVFPEDKQLIVERLVALWVAVGDAGMEKKASQMVALLERDFVVRDVKRSIHKNKILSCKIHEKYHVVARYACPELPKIQQQTYVSLSHCKLPEDLFKLLKYVKALVLSSCNLEQLSDEVGSLTVLKFLDLSGNPLKLLPETIGYLKCLESLHLHSCYLLLSLPQRIGDLSLRNLRINHTADELHNLPEGFEKLTSMKTLDVFKVGGTYDNIKKLKELNDLVDIRISVHGIVRFSDADLHNKSKLENLELCFVGKGRDQEMEACVKKLEPPANLEMLMIEDYHGIILPMWILAESLINKLKRLSLRTNESICTLPALWKLSSLEFLWLYEMPKITHLGCEFFGLPKIQQQISGDDESEESSDYSEYEDDHSATSYGEIIDEGRGEREESAPAFRSLKTLRIEYLENWEIWEDADAHYEKQIKVMPSLEVLFIAGCPNLQGRPLRILRDTPWFEQTYIRTDGTVKEKNLPNLILAVDVGRKHDSNIQELKDLKDDHIRMVIHGKVDFRDSDLGKKAGIRNLKLYFVGDGRKTEQAMCIEELVPPPNLQILRIDDYPGFRLPHWILADSIINKLTKLSVRSNPNIISLPRLWKLSCLEFLWLFDFPRMERLGREFFGYPNKLKSTDDSLGSEDDEEISAGGTSFPNLKTLRIEYLQNWEKWEDIDKADEKRITVMPSLKELIIADCPKLQAMPLRILGGTPWLKEKPYGLLRHTKYQNDDKPSTSRGNAVEIEHQINDKTNDKPSTSKGKESNEIEPADD